MRPTNRAPLTCAAACLAALLAPRAAAEPPAEAGRGPKPPGELVDLGGYRLHLHCAGRGTPAVVLVPGAGDFSSDWALVQPGVAKFARACAYDRAGAAWSDP